jgi:acyl carrier protein
MPESKILNGDLSKIIGAIVEKEVDPLNMAARLVEDYGADSMDVVDIVERVERVFSIAIPHRDVEKLVTFGDILTYVAAKGSQPA